MEETEVELKVPHDPISMIQEIERFRKTGKRDKSRVNTKHILFIMSGAFADLDHIIHKRISDQSIGFGASIYKTQAQGDLLQHVRSEDLIEFGFESEFVGRLPVRAVFDYLTEDDLFHILKNPNNPIILGKKLDFAAYNIDIKFEDQALRLLAKHAFEENTGARGLVSAVERALLPFEKFLPSTDIHRFPVTPSIINDPEQSLEQLMTPEFDSYWNETYQRLFYQEHEYVKEVIRTSRKDFSEKYNLTLTESRIDIVANFYCTQVMDIENAIKNIKSYYDEIKTIELSFFKTHDINIVLEEDAIDYAIQQVIGAEIELKKFYNKLTSDFEYGLKLIQEKTNRNRFFITKDALISPESFLKNLIKDEMQKPLLH
jgi:hypothetical protein